MQARRKIIDGVLNFVDNTGRRSLYFKKIFSGMDSGDAADYHLHTRDRILGMILEMRRLIVFV
jgi:hypothetical protein